jgi:hypothetical protein
MSAGFETLTSLMQVLQHLPQRHIVVVYSVQVAVEESRKKRHLKVAFGPEKRTEMTRVVGVSKMPECFQNFGRATCSTLTCSYYQVLQEKDSS